MSELDRIWNSNTPALLAAEIIADARKKAETHEKAKARAAEKQRQKNRSGVQHPSTP
jgi:hypothetical protein